MNSVQQHYPASFVKTITVDRQPLVLRFVKNQEQPAICYEIKCINNKDIPALLLQLQENRWVVANEVPYQYHALEERVADLIVDTIS